MPAKCLPKFMWWTRGERMVEVIGTGHYPTTAMVRCDGLEFEVEIEDLRND